MSSVKVTNLLHGSSASNNIVLASDGTTTIDELKATTELLVGGVSSTANGGTLQISNGITFPATQSACSDVNTLDDYEEGTWTPNQGAGLTVTGAFTSSGFYIKVGRQVTVWATVRGATNISVATAGTVVCTNLPFTAGNTGAQNGSPGIGTNWANDVLVGCSVGSTTLYATTTVASTLGIMYCATYNVS